MAELWRICEGLSADFSHQADLYWICQVFVEFVVDVCWMFDRLLKIFGIKMILVGFEMSFEGGLMEF